MEDLTMFRRLISRGFVCTLVLIAAMTLVSCEKIVFSDGDEISVDKGGNLQVRVFQVDKTPFAATTRAAASEACSRLNIAIYNTDGSHVKQLNQLAMDKNFGMASFQLDEGDYMLVVVGHSANGNPTMTNPQKISFTNAQGYTDTFLASGDITIGEEPEDVDVTLERIVALCCFCITDYFPADVAKMQFYYTGGSGAFSAYTGLGSVNSKQMVTFDVSSAAQKQFDLYTFQLARTLWQLALPNLRR